MKIKKIWIQYEDERGDSYMAPATEADFLVLTGTGKRYRRQKPVKMEQTERRYPGKGRRA